MKIRFLALSLNAVLLATVIPISSFGASSCEFYPIAIAAQRISNAVPGDVLADVLNGTQPGNFGWLTWAGSPSEPTLVRSLTPPGDSATYVNPDNPQDHQISVGDWIQGKPGVSNGKNVRDALDALKQIDIAIPVWDQIRGQGASAAYRVSGFARVRLLSYQLPGQSRITVRYLGSAACGLQNYPPTANAGADQTNTLPATVTLNGTVTDDGLPAGAALSVLWSFVGGPANVSFSDPANPNTTVSFSAPGTYVFRLTANDSALSASDDATVTVNRENHPPVAFSQSVTNFEDATANIILSGFDENGDALEFIVITLPSHGALAGTTPNLQYTPLADYNGPDSFTFKVRDGALESGISTVAITNLPVNDRPVADGHDVTTAEDAPITVMFSGADVDGDPLTFSVVQQPTNGTLTVTATNATYVPARNYHGTDGFTYVASDGMTNSVEAAVSIAVVSVNDIPLVDAGPDQLISLPLNSVSMIGLVSDDDFDGTTLSVQWSVVSGPGGVSFSLSGTNAGAVATFETNGVYTLRLTADDGLAYGFDDVVITANAPPLVNAGSNQLVNLPAEAALNGVASDDALPTNQVTVTWRATGPGTVIFSNPASTNTTASFSASGLYTLQLVANDGAASSTGSVTVLANRAPTVDAGAAQTITNLFTTMAASVNDDSFPSNALNLMWTKVSGPGESIFATNTPNTLVTFSTNGTYVLRLTADDLAVSSSSDVTVHINGAPVVNAGADQRIVLGNATQLSTSVTDDGLPPDSTPALYWQVVSGPGIAAFDDANAAQTGVSFNAPGVYLLRLTANDSQLVGSDELTITVLPPNEAPSVSAGASQLVNFPASAALHGTVTDDGYPEDGTLTVSWSKFAGPGAVTFATPTQNDTAAGFDAPGVYVLAFAANDSELSSTSYVAIVVNDPPQVSAGPDQITTISNQLTLHGIVSDDALPFGLTNIAWAKVSGPGTVFFTAPTFAETSVRFSVIGEYVLRLSATDSNAVTSDEVSISVRPDGANLPPVVSAGSNQVVALTNAAWLTGSVTDDALPYGVPLIIAWTKVSGPGDVTFADSNAVTTAAAFSTSGTYVLQLTANDSEFIRSAEVTISIYLENLPPVVHAGDDQSVIRGPVTLSGSVLDDGFPTNGTLTVHWQMISGPGVAIIEHANSTFTAVSFGEPGVYVFRLTANDGQLPASDDVTITVTGNQPPIVNAGSDQVLDLIVGTGAAANSTTTYPAQSDAWRYAPSQPGLSGLYGNVCCTPAVRRGGLAYSGNDLYVGGGFLNANGLQVQSITRWDGCTYYPLFDPRPTSASNTNAIGLVSGGSAINPIAAYQNELFVVGGFLKDLDNDGRLEFTGRWTGTNWFALNPPIFSSYVSGGAMLATSNAVYLGGQFMVQETVGTNTVICHAITKWTGTNWTILGQGVKDIREGDARNDIMFSSVSAMAVAPSGDLYVAGSFITQTATGLATNLARWTGSEWQVVDNRLSGCIGFNCSPSILALGFAPNGDLIVGGNFIQAGGTTVNHIARWDGTNWFALGSGFNSAVVAMTLRGGEIFAGGPFTQSGSSNISRLARWNGTAWTALSNGVGASVAALASTPSGVYVGGDFSSAGPQVANGIAKWGVNETATVNGPSPISVQTTDPSGAAVAVTLQVKHPCGVPLTLTWNADGGAAEFTNGVSGAVQFVNASFTNFYAPGVHTLFVTVADGQNGPITFSTTITVMTPAVVPLAGSITDDGLPSPANLTGLWQEVSGPPNVSFANATATNTTASFAALGTYILRLTGGDSELQSSDDVMITVRAAGNVNRPPTVDVGPNQNITIADAAALNGIVFDDGLPSNQLALAWSQLSGPGTATFDSPTSAVASVTFDAAGSYVLRLTADDGEFASYGDLIINVSAVTNQPPVVSAGPDQATTVNRSTRLYGSVTDDGLPYGTVTSSWVPESSPGTVLFRMENGATYALFSDPGEYVLRLTANDGRATAFDDVTVTVYSPSEVPFVEITSPLDAATITAPTTVTGTVSSAILRNWMLQYRLKPSDTLSAGGEGQGEVAGFNWTTLTTGTVSVANAPLGIFDPTLLLNGIYELKLSALDNAGRVSETEPVTVVVDRNMKVGNFTLSFNDLTIPVAGIPIQVIRTYDSRDKREGDFGVGWTLQLKDIRLQKNRHLGKAWDESTTGGLFPSYCIDTLKPRIVTITFPDNKVYKFLAAPAPACQFGVPLIYPRMSYTPLENTRGTLTPVLFNRPSGERLVDDQLVFAGAVPGRADFVSWELLLDPPPGPADNILYNPDLFEFTTLDGYTYLISETNGLRSMTDPNGNTLIINANGLTWTNAANSATLAVQFRRDTRGRITNILDALGHAMSYRYDTNGNLVTFTDREGNTNGFSYSPQHQLLAIVGSSGAQTIANAYDAEGRLISTADGLGHAMNYARDLAERREYVTNRLGFVTNHQYDERGNVIQSVDALGVVSTFAYDENDNVLSVSNAACACVTQFTYDASDNRLSMTDAAGNTIRYIYDSRRHVLTHQDPAGFSTTNAYDPDGNLLTTRDAMGLTTEFTYYADGHVATMIDQRGGLTQFAYDSFGRLTNEVDPLGSVTSYTVDANGSPLSQTQTRSVRVTAANAPKTARSRSKADELPGTNDFHYDTNIVTRFEYDANGAMRTVFYADSRSMGLSHDSAGRLIAMTNQAGQVTTTLFSQLGKPLRIDYPDNTAEQFAYDAEGQLITFVDRSVRTTTYTYDARGNITETRFADGSHIQATYNDFNQLVSERDQLGFITTYEYDLLGNRVLSRNPLGHVTRYTYNAKRACTSVTDAINRTTYFEYDYLNRNTRITYPDGTFKTFQYLGRELAEQTDEAGQTSRSGFDLLGRRVGVTNALGEASQFTYDQVGNRISAQDADGRTTRFDFDQMGRRTQTIQPDGSTTSLTYDALGRVIASTDPAGRATTFAYDAAGRLLNVVNALGQVSTWTYDAQGNLVSFTATSSRTTGYAYDALGRRVLVNHPDGTSEGTTYNLAGRATLQTDQAGFTTGFGYDAVHRLARITDAAGRNTLFSYDAVGRRISQTDPESRTTSFEYDLRDRPVKVTYADGTFARTIYDLQGRVAASIDPNGRVTRFGYDAANRLVGITNAEGAVTSSTYDAVGRVASQTDALGRTTTFEYDSAGRLSRVTLADGSFATSSYDIAGRRTAAVDPRGNATHYGYDGLNRLTAVTNALGEVTGYSYDTAGRLAATTDALGRTRSYAYDAMGRLTVALYPDGTTRQTEYDVRGLPIRGIDQAGNVTSYHYDSLGRLAAITNALGGVTSYGYDVVDRLTAQTDALGRITTYSYDALGRRASRTLPGGESEFYGYDANGNLTSRIDFNGDTNQFLYDALNRPVQMLPDTRRAESVPISYSYDALGLRTNMVDASGVTVFAYDHRNRLVHKATPQGALNYTYDANGNVLSVTSGNVNGAAVSYEYDVLNRLSAVTDAHVGRCAYSYDAVGNYLAHSLPNGLTTAYAHDAMNRVTTMVVTNTSSLYASNRYALDVLGQRVVVEELGGRMVGYGYDALQRLTNETIAATSGSGALNYLYDAVGNRLALDSSLGAILPAAHGYDANDRLREHSYDANGNTLAATNFNPLAGLPAPVADLYDFRDRLIRRDTTLNSQPSTISLQYDGDGNRVRKSVNGATTQYLVDELNPTGWPQVLEELTSMNGGPAAVTRTYTWGHALLAQDQLVGTTWQAGLPLHDAHGSVRHLTDLGGNVTDSYEYDAFGNLIARAGTTPNNHLYTGEQFDPDLGLYYLRARYHNPAQGRFWSQDSFEGFTDDPASLHKYAYAQNNPANYVDPSGYFSLNETLAVSGLAPLVSQSLSGIWDGINHYSHGLAGGSALKATSHAEALFINSLAAGPGLNLGKQNFWRTAKGAPLLLNWNPTIYIPLSDCFDYEVVGGDLHIYGCAAKFPVFAFGYSNDPLFKWTEKALDVGKGSLLGAELRDAAQFYSELGSQGTSTTGNFLLNNLSSGLNLVAGAVSPESYVDAYNDVSDNAYRVMVTEMNGGSGRVNALAQGISSAVGDAVGYNDVLTAIYGVDRHEQRFLAGWERATHGASGISKLAGTAAGLTASMESAVVTEANGLNAAAATQKAGQKVAAGVERPPGSVAVKLDECQKAAKRAEQLALIKQDSIGRWWGVRGDSGQMRPIGSIQPGSASVHGNSALSPNTAYLYRLEDANTGTHLKWGITDDPSPFGRYPSDFLRGKVMIIEDQGPRSLMLKIERDMVEIDAGPLNKEPWAGKRLR